MNQDFVNLRIITCSNMPIKKFDFYCLLFTGGSVHHITRTEIVRAFSDTIRTK